MRHRLHKARHGALAAATATLLCLVAAAAQLPPPASGPVDFKRDIEPIFQARCVACHGAAMQMNGLRLDGREPALAGGSSGAAIVPGNSAGSRLVEHVSGARKPRMPMSGPPLSAEQVSLIRAWIDQGAKWPESAAGEAPRPADAGSRPRAAHWAFVAPKRPAPPAVVRRAWVRNPIDAFVLARLEREGVEPSPEADRVTLLRRVALDLTGLPPTLEEVEEFVADNRSDAYERVVDRLLASPHYGERWALPWLDLAHYADSDGFNDGIRPHAWRYRHWVIDALNRNLPFDRFTIEQVAGDLLPAATVEAKVATGFLRNTMTNRETGTDSEEFRVEQIIDRTATVGTVWLGLTVGCARCHNHKYDPISQKEFYQLFAFFNSDDEVNIEAPLPGEMGPYLARYPEYQKKRRELIAQYRVAELMPDWERRTLEAADNPEADLLWILSWKRLAWLSDGLQAVLRLEPARRTRRQQDLLTDHFITYYGALVSPERAKELNFGELAKKLAALAGEYPGLSEAQTIAARAHPRSTRILVRGDFRNPGAPVEPGTPAILHPLASGEKPTRLALARWLVSKENPLTARVTVNRMWQELFGRGLVETSEDFGARGERPSHPELLDWLATEFMDGWDSKHIQRLIVTSATYRQRSRVRPDLATRDPQNRLLARQSRLRLPAELVRDVTLAASGLLNTTVGGRSVSPSMPTGMADLGHYLSWKASTGQDLYRRGLYTLFKRVAQYPQLAVFDAPDRQQSCSRRDRSTTPLQALNLLNDPVFLEAAQGLAARTLRESSGDSRERIAYAFRLCLGRPPAPAEADRLARYFENQAAILAREPTARARLFPAQGVEGTSQADDAAWVALSSVLLNLDEFITRE